MAMSTGTLSQDRAPRWGVMAPTSFIRDYSVSISVCHPRDIYDDAELSAPSLGAGRVDSSVTVYVKSIAKVYLGGKGAEQELLVGIAQARVYRCMC